MNEEKSNLDELIEKEYGKYNFPPFEKERINMKSFETIRASIKYLVAAKKIGPALSSIIFNAVRSLQGKGIEIRKNTFVRADQLCECVLCNCDPQIKEIRIKIDYNPVKDCWSSTKVEVDGENFIFIQGEYSRPDNANEETIKIVTSEKGKKLLQIILKEAEKIKSMRLK